MQPPTHSSSTLSPSLLVLSIRVMWTQLSHYSPNQSELAFSSCPSLPAAAISRVISNLLVDCS